MPNTDKDKPKILSPNIFPLLALAHPAGGLDAFKKLLKTVPENSGMAFMLVQHLDPTHESLLPDLLQKNYQIFPYWKLRMKLRYSPAIFASSPATKMMTTTESKTNQHG